MSLRTPTQEIIHGVAVNDPYRWLEDRNSPATEKWVCEQQQVSDGYFSSCPNLSDIENRVREYLGVEMVDQPARVHDRYFYRKRSPSQEQGRIFVRDGENGEERVLIDPASEGMFASVSIYRISPEADLLAYAFKRGGGDRSEIRIVDVNRGVTLPDSIPMGYARGFAFAKHGYFYAHETDASPEEHTVRYHGFGSSAPDGVVFRVPQTTGSRLILAGNAQRIGAIWIRPKGAEIVASLAVAGIEEAPAWNEVFAERRLPCGTILYQDKVLAVVEAESTRSKVIELSLDGNETRTLIPESEDVLRQLVLARDRIFLSYLSTSGSTTLAIWHITGERLGSVPLPADGTVQILPVYDENAGSVFYTFESFDTPPTIYEYRVESNTSKVWHRRGTAARMNRCDVQEASVLSKGGTRIRLTLVSSVPRKTTAHTPVIMTSYGGFGAVLTPRFSVLVAILVDMGAVFAMPHIRGGGEGGKEWHDAGRARNRQSSFDDFIATAEWLCGHGVTEPGQIGIFGGSNSGLLVAAVMTQRPDLFGAVVCIAPLLDMVRYEVFDQAAKWRGEFGTIEDADDFRALHAYSPYHRIAQGANYPATLFVTGDKDDRCNPAHVRKMAARLKGRVAQKLPVIVDYSAERGHSPVLPLSVRVGALARRIAFLCRQLQIPVASGGYDETAHR
jgi:prolyl oligopeptidase